MPNINFNKLTDLYTIDPQKVEDLILHVINSERAGVKEITLILTDDDYLNKMKIEYFDEDVLTDTITFNMNNPEEAIEGEMYLSGETIDRNSAEFNTQLDREFANVVVHSTLHLIGYEDHNEELRQQMFDKQEKYLNTFNYTDILVRN